MAGVRGGGEMRNDQSKYKVIVSESQINAPRFSPAVYLLILQSPFVEVSIIPNDHKAAS